MTNHSFSGKTALVTGCGRGIGKAIAKTLAQAGADHYCPVSISLLKMKGGQGLIRLLTAKDKP